MAVRDFNGTSDVIKLALPTYAGFGDSSFTIVAVIKRDTSSNYHGICSIGDVGAANPALVWEYENNAGAIEYVRSASDHARETAQAWGPTGTWLLIAMSKTLSTKVRFHRFNGSTWLHVDSTTNTGTPFAAHANWDTGGGSPELRLGNWNASFNFFDGKMAVQAIWAGTALSDANVEALAGGNRGAWASAGATHLWELNQASTGTSVTDFIGSLNQTGISGTSVVTGDDPGSGIYNFTTVTTVTGSDSATGTDAATASVTLPGSQTATGTDTGTASATATGSQTATGTDAATASITLSGADTASGTDAGVVTGPTTPIAGSDSATATETGTVADVTPLPEAPLPAGGRELITDETPPPPRLVTLRGHDYARAREAGTIADLTPPPAPAPVYTPRPRRPARPQPTIPIEAGDYARAREDATVEVVGIETSSADSGRATEHATIEVFSDPAVAPRSDVDLMREEIEDWRALQLMGVL